MWTQSYVFWEWRLLSCGMFPVSIHLCYNPYSRVRAHARAHTHTHTHTRAHTRARAHTHAHTHARAHTHTRTHTRAHTHTHTRARWQTNSTIGLKEYFLQIILWYNEVILKFMEIKMNIFFAWLKNVASMILATIVSACRIVLIFRNAVLGT
jgi:cation transport ATPase